MADVVGHGTPDKVGAAEFVLSKDEEEKADGDAQEGQCSCLLVGRTHFVFSWAR